MKPRTALRLVAPAERPLARLSDAERRINGRDFGAEPWLVGEGPRFFTPERVAKMAADNELLRAARKGRK